MLHPLHACAATSLSLPVVPQLSLLLAAALRDRMESPAGAWSGGGTATVQDQLHVGGEQSSRAQVEDQLICHTVDTSYGCYLRPVFGFV
ncbi:hypothetical protein SORBI_3008G020400 [Sorghum bicolor]|uniref:Secreted protein n=1 Tax=Sorghum bicolor TaxID=4558 RepID=C5YQR6_SORBI|nr:hypothetical protein SORBI_3008G020400 [Sorghum bicolor]